EVNRGFSGEGQVLQRLAAQGWQEALPHVRSSLRWQARINPHEVGTHSGLAAAQVEAALAVLGSRGLVGFDLASAAYFHRELPFDMDKVEALHPRLIEARQIIAKQQVRIVHQAGSGSELQAEAYV